MAEHADSASTSAGTPQGGGGSIVPPPTPGAMTPADEAQVQRASLVRIVRMAFMVMMTTVTLLYILNIGETRHTSGETVMGLDLAIGWHIPLTAGILLMLIVLAVDMLTPRKKIATISGVFFGLLVGLIATWAMNFIVDLLVAAYEINTPTLVGAIKVLIGICLCYLGMSVVLQTQDDFRLVIPYVEFAKQLRGPRPLVLDTSALIDARVADLASTGVFAVPLVIPRFVVEELQALGDSADKMKRARGRRGLDVIGRLQRIAGVDLTIDETPVQGKAVDQMLVELARAMPASILTADTGLDRVAAIHGVSVLNLNQVANALKPSLLPGSRLNLHVLRRGEQPGQGVGYLDDGTMVVAENADRLIGSTAELEVTSAMQTSAGRLIFARPVDPAAALPADADDAGAGSSPLSASPGGMAPAQEVEIDPPRHATMSSRPPSRPSGSRNPRR